MRAFRPARPVGIVSLGASIPERVLSNGDLERMVDTSDEWIVTRTGIRERRIAAPGQATSDLAVGAAREALERAGVTAREIDLVIVATCTPDMPLPATACLVQAALGASEAAAFDLDAACSGFVYALATAAQYVGGGACDTVLVVGAETLSRIVNWRDRSTCVLMGDGAAAAVVRSVRPGHGVLGVYLSADGGGADLLRVEAGGSRLPVDEAVLREGRQYLTMNGREVFRFAVTAMGDAAERALAAAGLTADDVAWFVPHQANYRIIDAAARRFGFPLERVIVNLDRYGNTSAASVPLALWEAERDGRLREGDVVLAVAFGAGLTCGAAAMRWGG